MKKKKKTLGKKVENYIRWQLHRFIKWYVLECGGAFHTGPYGELGFYIVAQSDERQAYLNQLEIADMEGRVRW